MSRKSAALLLVLVVSPLAVYLLWPTEEARIRKLVREAVRAVEAEDVEAVMSKVSYNYSDEHGLSYLLLKKALEARFRAYADIDVEYENLQIHVQDGRATATMDMGVIAGEGPDRGYYLGGPGRPARLVLRLQRGGPLNRWLVVGASGYSQGGI